MKRTDLPRYRQEQAKIDAILDSDIPLVTKAHKVANIDYSYLCRETDGIVKKPDVKNIIEIIRGLDDAT